MRIFHIAAAALILGGMVVATWFAVSEFVSLYGKADPNLKLGVITALGSGAAFLWNNLHQSRRERQARLFENKREAYDHFFEFFFSIFAAQKSGKPLDEGALAEKFGVFTRNVMTWGSAPTINAVNRYQVESLRATGGDMTTLFKPTEDLLRALRKDLGHSDSALERYALTKLILRAEEHHKLG